MEAHNGRINVFSRPNEGSTLESHFRITLHMLYLKSSSLYVYNGQIT